MRRHWISLLTLSVCLTSLGTLDGATHQVDSSDAIADLMESNSVSAGDVIVWKAGVYSDQEIELNGNHGTPENPITLRAETPGHVIFRGESQLRTNAQWWVIEGFHFDGSQGGPNAYNPIQFRGSGDVGAEHTRLTNCAFTALNNGEETAKWIQIYGRFNRIDHCQFSGKPNKGALLTVELGALAADESAEHVIEWNYFSDIAHNEGSDNETIRIGFSGDQNKPARCVVQHNLFVRCDGETEIISNKSSYNRYTSNTFRQCNGSLVLRHGHHVTVNGNYFLGEGATDAGGIRINDSHHHIFNNYLQDLTGLTWNAALSIEGGKKASGGTSSGYQVVEDITVAHNTLINCTKSIYLSDKHGKHAPTGLIANNLIAALDANEVLVDASLPTDQLTWEQNLFHGSTLPEGLNGLIDDPQLQTIGAYYRPASDSPVVDAAAGTIPFVTADIENQARPESQRDMGADEINPADTDRPLKPLAADQVGVSFLPSAK